MKKVATLLFALAVAFILPQADSGEVVKITEQQIGNLGIELGRLQKAETMPLFKAPAQVTIPPAHEFIVSAPQDGLVSKVETAVGDQVSAGQTLAQLNSPDLLALQRSLLNAASGLSLAEAKYSRDETLYQEGVISKRRLEESRSDYNVQSVALSEARQLLEIAGMSRKEIDALHRTRKLSSLLEVRSPVNGAVLEKMVVAGQRVDVLAPMFRVASMDTLWLEISVPQEKLHLVQLGDRVVIENTGTDARVALIGKNVNPHNQSVLVRALIENAPGQVRPGQTVSARLIQATGTAAFKVPHAAVARRGGESYLFIRTAEGFEARPVEVIGNEEENSIVRGDLKGDEQIAVQGVVALKANLMGLGGGE